MEAEAYLLSRRIWLMMCVNIISIPINLLGHTLSFCQNVGFSSVDMNLWLRGETWSEILPSQNDGRPSSPLFFPRKCKGKMQTLTAVLFD